jgi:hypothetical protein
MFQAMAGPFVCLKYAHRYRRSCATAMDGGSVGVAGAFTCLTGDSGAKRDEAASANRSRCEDVTDS